MLIKPLTQAISGEILVSYGCIFNSMKYLTFHATAFFGAALIAFVIAYLAHVVLGVPRHVIRIDALGMVACVAAFIGVAIFAQRRG